MKVRKTEEKQKKQGDMSGPPAFEWMNEQENKWMSEWTSEWAS